MGRYTNPPTNQPIRRQPSQGFPKLTWSPWMVSTRGSNKKREGGGGPLAGEAGGRQHNTLCVCVCVCVWVLSVTGDFQSFCFPCNSIYSPQNTHTHPPTHPPTYLPTYSPTLARSLARTHACMPAGTRAPTHGGTPTHARPRTDAQARMPAPLDHMHARLRARMHAHARPRTPTHTRLRTPTHARPRMSRRPRTATRPRPRPSTPASHQPTQARRKLVGQGHQAGERHGGQSEAFCHQAYRLWPGQAMRKKNIVSGILRRVWISKWTILRSPNS